jgi:CheY-like chemotaxis protein
MLARIVLLSTMTEDTDMETQRRTILVVDDDPDVVHILTRLLGAAGYHVVAGYGGEDALRKLRREHVDLVLTDLAMPRMSGVELIGEIRNDPNLSDMPILCVTAFVWDRLGRSAGDLGCDGFVSKPLDARALLSAVEKCLPRRGRLTFDARVASL